MASILLLKIYWIFKLHLILHFILCVNYTPINSLQVSIYMLYIYYLIHLLIKVSHCTWCINGNGGKNEDIEWTNVAANKWGRDPWTFGYITQAPLGWCDGAPVSIRYLVTTFLGKLINQVWTLINRGSLSMQGSLIVSVGHNTETSSIGSH